MVLDVLALVLGIWLTIRKLDVRKREAAECPAVDPADFARWKQLSVATYNLGSVGCFGKLVLDYAWQLLGPRLGIPWGVIRVGGLLLFLAWVAVLVWVWVQSARARKLSERLHIRFPPRPAPDPDQG